MLWATFVDKKQTRSDSSVSNAELSGFIYHHLSHMNLGRWDTCEHRLQIVQSLRCVIVWLKQGTDVFQ